MAGADSAVEKKRREYRLRLFAAVTKQPAEQIRTLALQSRNAFSERLTKAKDTLGDIFRRWKPFEEDLFAAQFQIDEGDKLSASTEEADRKKRRSFYGRAYVNLIAASDRLDEEESAGGTGFVFLQKATEAAEAAAVKTAETVEKTAEQAADIVGEVGSALDNKITIVAVGLALALAAFGFAKGRR